MAFAAPAQADGRHGQASPGAAGIGDRLFPTLGNGGYDVLHYHLDLRYATSAPSQAIDGDVTIAARATQSLSRFNLDFGGASVGSVSVNGRTADWTREGEELVITPRRALARHRVFKACSRRSARAASAPSGRTCSGSRWRRTDPARGR